MTWQEELRQLDSALAGGELSANEYRKRRDEILAAASSAQPPSPVIGPPTGPRPAVPPEAESKPDAPDSAEVTQVVNVDAAVPPPAPVATESEGEVTQIIANPIKVNGHASATGDNEKTQVQQVVTDERTAPALQQPQWASLPPTQGAPTGVASFPPVAQQQPISGPTPTPLDAQDLFTSNKPARGGPQPWVVAVVVVAMLAVVGGAVWFFAFSGDDDTQNTANETTSETTEQAELPAPVDVTKIELPGESVENSGEMDITRASELGVIAPSEATLLAGAGADQLTYSGYSDGNFRYLLYAYKTENAAAAEELTGKILDIQKQLGFTDAKVDGVPDSVSVGTVTNEQASGLRGVYTYGDTTLQLAALQIPVGDAAAFHAGFSQAMTAVTDAAPPTK
jgi:hypothetical protein